MHQYRRGDRVRHPSKHEWGIGEVMNDSTVNEVSVFFECAGEKRLSLEVAELNRLEGQSAASPILDALAIAASEARNEIDHVRCKNCGERTHFPENAQWKRYTLGWCEPCYRQSLRGSEDKETGERVYSDEIRTIDGIKNRYRRG